MSLLTVLNVSAQLTQTNNAPAAGEMYSMYHCDSLTTSPGASGTNALWNFSSIATYSNVINNYSVQAVTTTTYPAANVAMASSIDDVAYLASSTGSLQYFGGNLSAGAVVGTITYTSPAIYATYPMNMSSSAVAATGGSLYIPSLSLSGTFTGNSSVLADGSGTIMLPGSVTLTNTLRVVTSQTLFVVSSLATATITQTNYNYYDNVIKAPVFSISTYTAVLVTPLGNSTTTQTAVRRNKDAVNTSTVNVSIRENSLDNSNFVVFPNPSNSFVNFATNHLEAKFVAIYDITGKLVEKQTLNEGKVKLDVSSYNKGLYLYTVSTNSNRTLKSGKFTVSQ